MKRMWTFAKRNALEMLRDPVIYVFCLGFPVLMIVLFQVIDRFTAGSMPVFESASLIPGIMMFSFTFVMLLTSLLVSKDRITAFLVRLYTSPMKTSDFVLGYMLPGIIVGIGQEIVCLLTGFVIALITGGAYFSFFSALLLMLEMLPMILICIFFGVFFGSVLNDKAAPGITSVFITGAGILGGAWMPLDTMGAFETFCRFLPFYPSVYIGRVITGAVHTVTDYENPVEMLYRFDSIAGWGIVPIVVFLVVGFALALYTFKRQMSAERR